MTDHADTTCECGAKASEPCRHTGGRYCKRLPATDAVEGVTLNPAPSAADHADTIRRAEEAVQRAETALSNACERGDEEKIQRAEARLSNATERLERAET